MSAGSDYVRHLAELRGIIEARDIRPGDTILLRCPPVDGVAPAYRDRMPHTVLTVTPEPGSIALTHSDGCATSHSSKMPVALVSLAESVELTGYKIGGAL